MKNIPFEKLLEVSLERAPNLDLAITSMVNISRAEAGYSSDSRSIARAYQGKNSETRDKVNGWLRERGYITMPSGMGSILGILNHPTEHIVQCVVSFNPLNETLSVSANGDLEEAKAVMEWVKQNYPKDGVTISTAIGFNGQGVLKFDKKFVDANTIKLARPSFYPWLSVPLEEYFKAFDESSENILVMYGPPGTGKSTFLRSLIMYLRYDAFLAYNKSVVESPELINRFYSSGAASLLAYEDIDKHLKRREDGNQLMSTLLNASDGVIEHKGKKIVFSTNLSTTAQIDEALLRVGRCFDILEFRELTPDEAAAVLVDVGRAPRDFSSKKSWSLSEILNEQVAAQQVVNRFGRKVGFN